MRASLIHRKEKWCPACSRVIAAELMAKNRSKPDGLGAYCLECNRRQQAEERARRGENYRAMRRRYRASDSGRNAYRAYRERHPTKAHAQNVLQHAVADGKLARPDTCSNCGDGGIIDAHHDDYSKPLEVRWLCRWCHQAWHREHGEAANANSARM